MNPETLQETKVKTVSLRDLPERDIKTLAVADRLGTKAKVSRFFLNALTMNVEQVKRYEADLFSDDFEIIGTQDKARLKNQFNLVIKDFKGLNLSYWQKKVVTACYCLIEKRGATATSPAIAIENMADLYAEVLERDEKGKFAGSERASFNDALEELQTTKQQIVFYKTVKDAKGKKKREYIIVQAPLIAGVVSHLTSEGNTTVDDEAIKNRASKTISFNPVIFQGLVDAWRLIPKNLSREIKNAVPDIERATPLMEDFILFLHGHAKHVTEVRRSRPVLAQELKIEAEYRKNKKRTTENLLRAYEIAKRTGYLTGYEIDQKGKNMIVDVFHLNPDRFEHLKKGLLEAEGLPIDGETSEEETNDVL